MALIELQGVARHYRHGVIDVAALDGVTLAIQAGEFVAVVGQSGSGKSTLMNVLGCLDQPTAGTFRIGGHDASLLDADELAALRRERFGFIFQRYHLLPHLDARANAALPAVYAGQAGHERSARAQALLSRLGLADRLGHRPNALSGGQQQRVSIARALMNGGQIILADEPTGALDSAAGAEMLALLRELNDAGHTIILVTHDPEVAAHARRVIELRDGRVRRDSGTPAGHHPPQDVPPAARAGPAARRWLVQWREAVATAFLALRGNRLRTALSMSGISIGIAAVVSILALTDAARESIENDMRGLLAGRIPVWRGNTAMPPGSIALPFRPAEVDAIRALDGVKAVSIQREMQLTARHGVRDAGVQAIGTDAQTFFVRRLRVLQGRGFTALDQARNAQVALIDERARDALFRPGETVLGATLMMQLNPGTPESSSPVQNSGTVQAAGVAMPMTVIGVAVSDSAGFSGFDNGMGQVLLPMSTYATKLEARADADVLRVMLDLSVPPARVREQIIHRLKALHGAEDFGTGNDEEEFQKSRNMLGTMAAMFVGVGAIALLVGGVGVMNIMLVSVSERTREIGIRMAVGARQGDVRLQFLIEAVVLCCLGGLVGVALSWFGAQGINLAQQQLKVQVSWAAVGVAFAVSSAVGLLFGTLPARRAAALSPVDALARE